LDDLSLLIPSKGYKERDLFSEAPPLGTYGPWSGGPGVGRGRWPLEDQGVGLEVQLILIRLNI